MLRVMIVRCQVSQHEHANPGPARQPADCLGISMVVRHLWHKNHHHEVNH